MINNSLIEEAVLKKLFFNTFGFGIFYERSVFGQRILKVIVNNAENELNVVSIALVTNETCVEVICWFMTCVLGMRENSNC